MTLLFFGAGSAVSQAETPSGNSALDQYYEQIPFPNGNGPVEPKGPDSAPDKEVVDRLSNSFGEDGTSAATVAYLTDPDTQSGSSSAGNGQSGGKPDDRESPTGSETGSEAGLAAPDSPAVASSVSPSMSTLGEFGGASLLILALALGTVFLLAVAARNRLNHNRSGR